MKKLCLVLCLVLLLGLCACGGEALTEADLSLTVSGTTLTHTATLSDVEKAFGAPESQSEAISCVYEGMDKTFTYADFILYTYPDGSADRLQELVVLSGDAATAKGVKLGQSDEDVKKAYGEPTLETAALLQYELKASDSQAVPAGLYFELTDGKVTAIGLVAEHRAE